MLDEDQREAHRGEVTPGSRSQGIQAKQGYTILCMEKGEGRVRFFIQKTVTSPNTGILSNLKKKNKKPLSKNKNKQTNKPSSSGSLPETGADNLLPGKRQTSKHVTPAASAFTHKPCFSPG